MDKEFADQLGITEYYYQDKPKQDFQEWLKEWDNQALLTFLTTQKNAEQRLKDVYNLQMTNVIVKINNEKQRNEKIINLIRNLRENSKDFDKLKSDLTSLISYIN